MPVDNAAEAISITGTPSLASTVSCFWANSGNDDSVRVNADAVSLKIRGVPGVPQLSTEDDRVANAPASKKPKPVYTTIARYETGEKAQYEPEDIKYRIFEHAHDFMYKSLQHYIPGDVKPGPD